MPRPNQTRATAKIFTNEALKRALITYKEDPTLGKRTVAHAYGIPDTTFRRYFDKHVDELDTPIDLLRKFRSNNRRLLTDDEEDLLIFWINTMCDRGFGYDKPNVLKFVDNILRHEHNSEHCLDRFHRPGVSLESDDRKWYACFMLHNSDLKKRKPEARGAVT